jgi:hypothetical protein
VGNSFLFSQVCDYEDREAEIIKIDKNDENIEKC